MHFKFISKNVIGNSRARVTNVYLYNRSFILQGKAQASLAKLKTHLPQKQNGQENHTEKTSSNNNIGNKIAAASGIEDKTALLVHDWLQSRLKYPSNFPKNKSDLKIYLSLKISLDGKILDATILQSSGIASLDKIIMDEIENIGFVLPVIIPLLKEPRQFKVWIVFKQSV
ncbi:MAG: TonB C-terminal domain-containing protein [Gammaproteobacteria bacterium]|nr:TonB C-terminal domain-containing protein [Gammaproteobacteria bacterium]